MAIDSVTKEWIRNASDERAAANGCRIDLARGQAVVDWIERHCCLFEGVAPGTPLVMGDWQLDVTLRLFGWVRWSDEFKRRDSPLHPSRDLVEQEEFQECDPGILGRLSLSR